MSNPSINRCNPSSLANRLPPSSVFQDNSTVLAGIQYPSYFKFDSCCTAGTSNLLDQCFLYCTPTDAKNFAGCLAKNREGTSLPVVAVQYNTAAKAMINQTSSTNSSSNTPPTGSAAPRSFTGLTDWRTSALLFGLLVSTLLVTA